MNRRIVWVTLPAGALAGYWATHPKFRHGATQLGHAVTGLVLNRPLEWEDPDTGEITETERVTRRSRWILTRPSWWYRLGAKRLGCGCGRRLGRMVWYSGDCPKHCPWLADIKGDADGDED